METHASPKDVYNNIYANWWDESWKHILFSLIWNIQLDGSFFFGVMKQCQMPITGKIER